MSNCSNCKNENVNLEAVPYIVHESAMARAERSAKRLWIAVLVLIIALIGTNGAWLYYESQFETITTEVTQENADGYNNYIGNDGDIVSGETDNKNN